MSALAQRYASNVLAIARGGVSPEVIKSLDAQFDSLTKSNILACAARLEILEGRNLEMNGKILLNALGDVKVNLIEIGQAINGKK